MTLLLILTLTLAVTTLTVLYIYPIVIRIITKKKVKVNQTNESDKEHDYKQLIDCVPLTVTGVAVCIALTVIHIFGSVNGHQYADEVLISGTYNIIAPLPNDVISVLMLIAGMSFSVIISTKRFPKSMKNDKKQRWEMISAAVISVNIIYVCCNYLPYMLAAFIQNPLITVFTYTMGVLFIVCFYLICLEVWCLYKLLKNKKYKKSIKVKKFLDTLLFCCMGWGIAFSFIILIFLITSIITLGRLDDFEELKSLVPSLLIAAFGLVLLKPTYNYVTNKIRVDDRNGEPASQEENSAGNKQNLPITDNQIPSTTND